MVIAVVIGTARQRSVGEVAAGVSGRFVLAVFGVVLVRRLGCSMVPRSMAGLLLGQAEQKGGSTKETLAPRVIGDVGPLRVSDLVISRQKSLVRLVL